MPTNLTGIRVVVVEDHSDSREILEEMLRSCGAVTMTVSTASEALAIAPDADIILTDFRQTTESFRRLAFTGNVPEWNLGSRQPARSARSARNLFRVARYPSGVHKSASGTFV